MRGMPLRRSVLAALWVPVAALLGPLVALRHGPPQLIGGAVVISMSGVAGSLWHYLDNRVGRRHLRWLAFAAGFAIGIFLAPTSYGRADGYYLRHLTYQRSVVVTQIGCESIKGSCGMYYARLSTPDGAPLPLNLYDEAVELRTGQRLTVYWDRLGYANPAVGRGATGLVPLWVWISVLGLYLVGTSALGYRAYRAARI